MGTKMGPSYANLFIGFIEHQFFRKIRKAMCQFFDYVVKPIVLKNFKLLQNDSESNAIFSQPPLISFKHDKKIGSFLVRSSFQTNDQLELSNVLAQDAKLVLSFKT